MPDDVDLRVGLAGFGAIGRDVAARLCAGVPGLRLSAVAARDAARARAALPPGSDAAVTDIATLPSLVDIVVECAPASLLPDIAAHTLQARRTLVVLSCGALLQHPDLIALARQNGTRILVPTGALLGLDAVAAAAEGTITAVRMITRKPPASLAGAPYVLEHGIALDALDAPLRVFQGSAREAAPGFPANLNVAAALSLAGVGPDRTLLELWADPTVDRNIHRIELESDAARLSMEIANVPSENPRTGRITAQSVVALLRKLRAPLAIGT